MENLLTDIGHGLLAALGIGLVIFVHESGHFLMARLCKVRVETFSLGFGPKLFGWRRGPTLYQVAIVPLGGYVKMAGEDALGEGKSASADELPSKSVGQRFLIYSGGVLANVAFAFIVFPFILANGVRFPEPLLGPSSPGSPAWHASLPLGTRVLAVNGSDVINFNEILSQVALGSSQETTMVVKEPGASTTRSVRLVPEYSEWMGAYSIGVTPASDPERIVRVARHSPAEQAGVQQGDQIIALANAPAGLSLDESLELALQSTGPIQARFRRGEREFDATIVSDKSAKRLGVGAIQNHVVAVRDTPLTQAVGVVKGDRILTLNARPILRQTDVLLALRDHRDPIDVRVERGGSEIALTGPVLDETQALALWRAWAIGADATSARISVTPGSAAAEAGIKDGDRIVAIDGKAVKGFDDITEATRAFSEGDKHEVLVETAGTTGETRAFSVAPRSSPSSVFGFEIREAEYVFKTDGPIQSIGVGIKSTWRFLEDTWLSLKRMLQGQVSSKKNLGGIIQISKVSFGFASAGITKLLFFLCLLSMNLAFLNVLPIPVLDGGHLFFLLVEKIKGSPVSERVLAYSQMVGLVLIVSLMVYVTFNDVVRLIGR